MAVATAVTASATQAFPPLCCEGRLDGVFWGLELLGNVAVWHTQDARQTLAITETVTLPGPGKRSLYVIEDQGRVHLATATETGCLRNQLNFPVSLRVLSLEDARRPLREACCTVAE